MTHLIKYEPVKASSHRDNKENIGQVTGVKQQKLQHRLENTETRNTWTPGDHFLQRFNRRRCTSRSMMGEAILLFQLTVFRSE